MRRIFFDSCALFSAVTCVGMLTGAAIIYQNRDAIVDSIKQQAIESLTSSIVPHNFPGSEASEIFKGEGVDTTTTPKPAGLPPVTLPF